MTLPIGNWRVGVIKYLKTCDHNPDLCFQPSPPDNPNSLSNQALRALSLWTSQSWLLYRELYAIHVVGGLLAAREKRERLKGVPYLGYLDLPFCIYRINGQPFGCCEGVMDWPSERGRG